MEQWKPIDGTDGKYEVSNLGRVRTNGKRPGLLTLTKQKSGYRYAMIQLSNGKQKNCRVHRLVAEHFLPNPDNMKEVNHKDGNKDNNHVSNLEWCTRSHNVKHSFDTGLKQPHRWTAEERKQISERNKQYAISHGYQPKPHRTMAEYQAERRAKAEERKRLKALQPKKKRGRPRKHLTDPGAVDFIPTPFYSEIP